MVEFIKLKQVSSQDSFRKKKQSRDQLDKSNEVILFSRGQ